MKDIKRINIKEFRKLGFLQELNRQFLHPMGLALEVVVDEETGEEKLGGIWDYRNDPERIIYDIANSDEERIKAFNEKANYVENHINKMIQTRIEKIGFGVEQISQIKENFEYSDIIDVDGIEYFTQYLRNPDDNIKKEFEKIKFPLIIGDIKCRLYQESNTMFSLLYILEESKQGFTKTYQKDDYYIDLETMTVKKYDKDEKQ